MASRPTTKKGSLQLVLQFLLQYPQDRNQHLDRLQVRIIPITCKHVCCGYAKHKGENKKFRLSESDRAKKFLDAAVFFQDETYLGTCDLQDISAVFGADLYFHKNCVRKYLV